MISNDQAPNLWAARIVVDRTETADCLPNLLLQQTVWASRDEAISFLERRMPQAAIPKGAGPGSRIIGQLAPAAFSVQITSSDDGPSMRHDLFVNIRAMYVYDLDEHGTVLQRTTRQQVLVAA